MMHARHRQTRLRLDYVFDRSTTTTVVSLGKQNCKLSIAKVGTMPWRLYRWLNDADNADDVDVDDAQ